MGGRYFAHFGIICSVLIFGGFLFFAKNQQLETQPVDQVFEPKNLEPSVQLTTQQKIAQLLAVSLTLTNAPLATESTGKNIQEIAQLQPGFVVLYGKKLDFTTVKAATDEIKNLATPIPITIAVDHEGGSVQRLSGKGFSPLDSWQRLCQADATARATAFTTTAIELKAAGITLVLGPMIDSATSSSKVMKTRICTADLNTLAQSAQEVLEIYQAAGLTPTLKHYPGIGTLTIDLHNASAQLQEAPPEQDVFRQLLRKNPGTAVMSAHAKLPNSDLPCSLSAACLQSLQAYNATLIITDDIAMESIYQSKTTSPAQQLSQLTQQAIQAGNNVVLLGPNVSLTVVQEIVTELTQLYEADTNFAQQVDKNLEKISSWKSSR